MKLCVMRWVEGSEAERPLINLTPQDRRNEEARDHEKDIDAYESGPATGNQVEMKYQYEQHRDSTQAINVGSIFSKCLNFFSIAR